MKLRRDSDATISEYRRSFGFALRDGDPAKAEAIAEEAVQAGVSVEVFYAKVIGPAQEWIGDLWQQDEASVAAEHLATTISQGVMARLYPHLLKTEIRSRAKVMLAAAEGEQHILGLRMVADTLEGAGFDVRNLGADVPVEAVLEACRVHEPAALGLTVSMWLNVPTLIREIDEVAALDRPPAIFVGGRGVARAAGIGLNVPVVAGCDETVAEVTRLIDSVDRAPPVDAELMARVPLRRSRPRSDRNAEETVAGAFSATALVAADSAREAARDAYRLEGLAYRDALTGLWNRRAYDDRIAELTDQPDGSALMLDVDEFKSINDAVGHEAGDAVLVGVGKAILDNLRPGDFGARFGGDEFVVLLPGLDTDEATEIAERIRSAVETTLRDPAVTVSIGLAGLTDDSRGTALSIDQALYAAKRAGRNTVTSWVA